MTPEAEGKEFQAAREDSSHGVETPGEAAKWAMLCHLAALSGFVIPFGNIAGPLAVWLAKRKTAGFVDRQGKEALNFQISMTVYSIGAWLLIPLLIGMPLLWMIALVDLIFLIIASVRSKEGVEHRYPLTLRLLK